jgi:predicted nucleotidyltransferase
MAIDFLQLLQRLVDARVEFAIVGGTAAVLHGASVATQDLDVLMPFTLGNCERLLDAVGAIHPRLSHTIDKRPLTLSAEELARFKNLYLVTDLGRLDVLGSLPPLSDVPGILARAQRLSLGNLEVSVLNLEDLITVKAALDRPKDKLVEVELRAIAEAKARE